MTWNSPKYWKNVIEINWEYVKEFLRLWRGEKWTADAPPFNPRPPQGRLIRTPHTWGTGMGSASRPGPVWPSIFLHSLIKAPRLTERLLGSALHLYGLSFYIHDIHCTEAGADSKWSQWSKSQLDVFHGPAAKRKVINGTSISCQLTARYPISLILSARLHLHRSTMLIQPFEFKWN